jgi:hypothetical protein
MHSALDSFYVLRLLPSALSDAKDLEGGLDNFCGKMLIYGHTSKRIHNIDPSDYFETEKAKNFTCGV